MTRKKRVDNNDSAACPSCGKLFHRGNVTAIVKLEDHMWNTGHSYCKNSNCPICGKQFHHSGNVTAIVKLKDHMRETGHSCKESNCPICGKKFHSGGYHPADQKLYHHMCEKDECHRQRARRMNWKKSSWSHVMFPRKLFS
eukprot:794970_1